MDDNTRADLLNRLRSIAGHINGIIRMIEEEEYCIDVLQQIYAVQAALGKVSVRVLDNHLHTCVTRALREDDPTERERVLREILDVFEWRSKA